MSTLTVGTIAEKVTDAGVAVDGVTLKDGDVTIADKIIHDGDTNTAIRFPSADTISFETGGSEAGRITSDRHVLIGTTTDGTTAVGTVIRDAGEVLITRDSNPPLLLNRNTSSGDAIELRKDNVRVGGIVVRTNDVGISEGDTGIKFLGDNDDIRPCNGSNSDRDNAIDLGDASARFSEVHATTGAIQTSDRNEKQDIEELNDSEKNVAVVAKSLLRKYRWKHAVEEKGDKARTHFGIIAQDLQDAFTAEGLDASNYAMFCSDTWTDEDGKEHTRLGIRYPQLLAFIISAI